MANQTPDVDPFAPLATRRMIDADTQRGVIHYDSDMGLKTTVPLQLLLDLARAAAADRTGADAILAEFGMYDVLAWSWTEPATADRGPLRRAARLLIQDVPLTVPVRRQLPDGSWGTVEVSPEEWARTEGRLTRGAGDVDQAVDDDQEVKGA